MSKLPQTRQQKLFIKECNRNNISTFFVNAAYKQNIPIEDIRKFIAKKNLDYIHQSIVFRAMKLKLDQDKIFLFSQLDFTKLYYAKIMSEQAFNIVMNNSVEDAMAIFALKILEVN